MKPGSNGRRTACRHSATRHHREQPGATANRGDRPGVFYRTSPPAKFGDDLVMIVSEFDILRRASPSGASRPPGGRQSAPNGPDPERKSRHRRRRHLATDHRGDRDNASGSLRPSFSPRGDRNSSGVLEWAGNQAGAKTRVGSLSAAKTTTASAQFEAQQESRRDIESG
jgi:hypothetical protein